ncbi:GyrI-like domain-containing protein [Mycoplasma sp. P36-A1]|uniref:GyrI-like domain-containing protein n=1 Tax=Mycoplasma sp. P36-A1 TaxID=3252900 RepID=UPI003C2B2F58
MEKIDYKKQYKDIYIAKKKPQIIDVEAYKYICVEYLGNPNNEQFNDVMKALYSMSYTVKMKSKNLKDYYDYVVFPLEGYWTLQDPSKGLNKDNFKSIMMIRQPDFLNEQLFEDYKKIIKLKNSENSYIDKLELKEITEGLSIQMLHVGPYDTEVETFSIMQEFAEKNNLERSSLNHKEIYLSDPRKTAPEKLKTTLRFSVKAK